MKKISRHATLILIEIFATSLAIVVGLGFFMHWKASNGGINLALLRGPIEKIVSRNFDEEGTIHIGQITLQRSKTDRLGGDKNSGPIRLVFDDVRWQADASDSAHTQLPRLAMRFNSSDLLRGNFRPRTIEVYDAKISLSRDRDGNFEYGLKLGGVQEFEEQTGTPFLLGLFGNDLGERAQLFDSAIIKNATLVFHDGLSGQEWRAEGAELEARTLPGDGYSARIYVPLQYGREEATLVVTALAPQGGDHINARMDLTKVPAGEMASIFIPEAPISLEGARLSGSIDMQLGNDGALRDADIDVQSSGGALLTNMGTLPFDSLHYQGKFVAPSRTFAFDSFNLVAGSTNSTFEGFISFGERDSTQVEFSLAADDVTLGPMNVFEDIVYLADFSATGLVDYTSRQIIIPDLTYNLDGAVMKAALTLLPSQQPNGSLGIKANGTLDEAIDTHIVVQGWPVAIAPGARQWVATHLPSGKVSHLRFAMDIPPDRIGQGQGLDDEMLDVTFAVDGAELIYVDAMPPLKNVRGKGHLAGNSFSFVASDGTLGGIKLVHGTARVPHFFPQGATSAYSVSVTGPVEEMVRLIHEPPLKLLQGSKLKPEMLSGTGSFKLNIENPMRVDGSFTELKITGEGGFSNTKIIGLLSDRDIDNAAGQVSLDEKQVVIDATAEIMDTPVALKWRREIGKQNKGSMVISGVMDTVTADSYGFSVRQFLRGRLPYSITLNMRGNEVENYQITADLTDSELNPGLFSWSKPVGVKGDLSLILERESGPDKGWMVNDFRISAKDLEVTGKGLATAKGKFLSAKIDRFYVKDHADFILEAKRTDAEELIIQLRGQQADISGLIGDLFTMGGGEKLPGRLTVDIFLDKLLMKDGILLAPFAASLRHNGQSIQALDIVAQFADEGRFSTHLQSDGSAYSKSLKVETNNLGPIVHGLTGRKMLSKGEGRFTAKIFSNGTLSGQFNASDLIMVDVPLIGRILSAGSLDGLASLLNDEGIYFSNASAEIVLDKQVLSFNKSRATGPSLGISLEGNINFNEKQFDLNGALAPAYQFNSMLGNIPGVGELLVSREGEGVVAFTYTVSGPMASPTITVNTLAALAPGIFRRLFDPIRKKRPTTEELLEEAISVVEEQMRADIPTEEVTVLPLPDEERGQDQEDMLD